MIEHPVPRQITTFEFKLIGELTVKQFGYLLFGSITAIVVYFLVPSFAFLNFVAASVPALAGIAFAFFPINERPLETWLKNFITRLISPTQYYFKKHNRPPKILMGITLPPRDLAKQHLLAKQKLEEYLQSKQKTAAEQSATASVDSVTNQKQSDLKRLIFEVNSQTTNPKSQFPNNSTPPLAPRPSPPIFDISLDKAASDAAQTTTDQSRLSHVGSGQTQPMSDISSNKAAFDAAQTTIDQSRLTRHFSLSGSVYTVNGVPLGGILLYLRQGVNTVRLFKTQGDGSFTNNLPLAAGEYELEVVDPKNKYSFAKMKIDGSKTKLEIYAQGIK